MPSLATVVVNPSGVIKYIYISILYFITPEGFTTTVANEGLEKARAYLNQVPQG